MKAEPSCLKAALVMRADYFNCVADPDPAVLEEMFRWTGALDRSMGVRFRLQVVRQRSSGRLGRLQSLEARLRDNRMEEVFICQGEGQLAVSEALF